MYKLGHFPHPEHQSFLQGNNLVEDFFLFDGVTGVVAAEVAFDG